MSKTATAPQSPQASYGRDVVHTMLRKVPEVTIWFWVIKVLCTTVGETFADYLTGHFFHDNETYTALFMGVFLVVALVFQFKARKYIPGVYWMAVVLISVVGTLITDNMVDHLGITLVQSTILWSILLAATFTGWYASEKTLSIHSIYTTRREAFYWLTILFTFALGTASGDLIAEKFSLGYALSVLLFVGLIALFGIGYRYFKLNAVLAFWACYILTRPLGASIGDLLSQPHVPLSSDPTAAPGLGLGTTVTSLIFLGAILAVVIYLSVTKADVEEMVEPHLREQKDEMALIKAASVLLGSARDILAAGVFARQEDHHAALVSGVNSGDGGTSLQDAGFPPAIEGGQETQMLVVVTDDSIHVLDWDGAGHAAEELMEFPRATTAVQVTRIGAHRHLNLADSASDTRLALTGSTSSHSPEATGDKLVVHLLGNFH